MPQQVILQNSVDTWVSSERLIGRFGDTRLYISSISNGLVFFSRPRLPDGAVITSATFKVMPGVPATTPGGVANISLRRLTSAFDPATVTWASQPGVGSIIQTLSRNPTWYNSGAAMVFDVTSEIQSIVNGANWYGWQLSSSTANPEQYVFGGQSTSPMTLEINYTSPPSSPSQLFPNTNSVINDPRPTLSWVTPGGPTSTQVSFRVQLATNAGFTTGVYTSNEIVSGASSIDLDLVSPSFTALTHNQSRYWRVQVKNDMNVWSSYSAAAQFTYRDPSTLSLTSPAATPPTPTPDVSWAYGGTQAVYQIMVYESLASQNLPGERLVLDSGYLYGTASTYPLPQGAITKVGVSYRIVVRVWDNGQPVSITGAPTYREVSQSVVWTPVGAVAPSQVVMEPYLPGRPGRIIRWEYTGSTAPGRFVIFRTRFGVTDSFSYLASSIREGSTNWYRLIDLPRGRADVTYRVHTIYFNGDMTPVASAPSVTQRVDYKKPWVMSTYDPATRHFSLTNAEIDPGLTEVSDVVIPMTGSPYLAQYSLQKFQGHASGRISGKATEDAGLTSEDQINNFLWIRQNPRVTFLFQDQAVVCYIYNMSYVPIGLADGSTDYLVEFDFVQE